MNLFTNFMTVIFYFFTRYCKRTFKSTPDPATGEELTEKNKKFELGKVLELPWVFWGVMGFSLFETSTAIVFQQNATELAQLRFGTDAVTAGWYTSVLQYAGRWISWRGESMLTEHQGSLSYLVLGFSLICLAIALLSVSVMIQSRGGTKLTRNSCSGGLRSWSFPFHVPRELGDNHERNSSCFWDIRMYPLPLN
jgi:hypothetical protein